MGFVDRVKYDSLVNCFLRNYQYFEKFATKKKKLGGTSREFTICTCVCILLPQSAL